MYPRQVPRTAAPHLRTALVERAAAMLAAREPVTLRSVVAGTGASTMAVYTHFGGMPGLWRAVRQEGFTRLGARLARVGTSGDPVRDLAALGVAYVQNALDAPTLYRAMFDGAADLEDPDAAQATFAPLVHAAARARDEGRFDARCDPRALATRTWAAGHGLAVLVVNGVLPPEALPEHAPALLTALFTDAGDDPERCRRSVQAAWATRLR
jgi:AcrR family transcriptional regulator